MHLCYATAWRFLTTINGSSFPESLHVWPVYQQRTSEIIGAGKSHSSDFVTQATLASMGISCCHVSVCPSVTSRCSTEMAKRRITHTPCNVIAQRL